MTRRVLLVTGDSSLLRELGDALGASEEDLSVMPCADDDRGFKRLIDFRPDFVIVSLALARDSKSPVADYGGLAFCKAAIAVSAAPIAIITPSPIPEAVNDAVVGLSRNVPCHPVAVRDGYIAKILDQIRSARPPPKRLEILIEANADNRWSYKLRGENFQYPFNRGGTLNFDLTAQALCKTVADIIGSVPPDWETQFENLGKVMVSGLFGVALFKDAQREIGFDDPKVVGTDPAKPLNKSDFQSLLTEPWDVIHFAGHAYHSPTADQNGAPTSPQHACLFVGAPDHPEAVEMNTIAPSLRETTSLLYLSGCKTANAGFAVAAAQYGVPAVLGFRWKVQDKPAEQHARLFYHQLFREKAIDRAFRNTRRGMRLLNRKDNAWASGMLVMASQ